MRIARWSTILPILMTLWVADARAFPIPPQTLRTLTNGSELIVSARVEKITLIKGEDGFNTGIARLNILSIVKGEVGSQSVDVYYRADMVCPAPPHYEEGDTALAFLTRSQRGPGYATVGLSYGAKSLNNREIEVYSARIRELIEIEEQTDQNTRRERLVEWLVRCAEEPATRWEGAYDLFNSHQSKMLEEEFRKREAQSDSEDAEIEDQEPKIEIMDFTTLLSKDQKRRLTDALYRVSSLSNGGMTMIELVELWGDENLIPFMWSYLKAFKKDYPWETENLMRELATLLKNQEALGLIEKFESGIYTDPEKEAQRELERKAILQKFIQAIERAGPPRIVEINNEPETPPDPSPHQQNAKGHIGLISILLAFAVLFMNFTLYAPGAR